MRSSEATPTCLLEINLSTLTVLSLPSYNTKLIWLDEMSARQALRILMYIRLGKLAVQHDLSRLLAMEGQP